MIKFELLTFHLKKKLLNRYACKKKKSNQSLNYFKNLKNLNSTNRRNNVQTLLAVLSSLLLLNISKYRKLRENWERIDWERIFFNSI